MGESLIEQRIQEVRDLLDDLSLVADDETVDHFEERLDELESELKEAFNE